MAQSQEKEKRLRKEIERDFICRVFAVLPVNLTKD